MSNLYYVALAFCTIALYAVMTVMSKKGQAFMPPFAFIAITMAVLSTSALVASLLFERTFSFSSLKTEHVVFMIVFGVINLVGFAMLLKTISGLPVAHYQILAGAMGPIFVALLAYSFLSEALTARFFLALPIIFVGLYVALGK